MPRQANNFIAAAPLLALVLSCSDLVTVGPGLDTATSDPGLANGGSGQEPDGDGDGDQGDGTSTSPGSPGSGGGSSGETLLTEVPEEEDPSEKLTEAEVCAGIDLTPESIVHEVPRTVTKTVEVEKTLPVAMYIVLDNSKSMKEDGDGTFTKWEQAKNAITAFAMAPDSAGVEVGIQFFHPIGQAVAGQDNDDRRLRDVEKCDGVAHAQSAIPVRPLPESAPDIVDALDATEPNSSTPTVGSLIGGVDFCAQFQEANPEKKCVVVFATDGQPNSCGLSLDCHPGFTPDIEGNCVDPKAEEVLTPIVAGGLTAGVSTYTLGMEGVSKDGFTLLNALAIAGGTDCSPNLPGEEACNVSKGGNAGLLETLNQIRDTIVVSETTTETITETRTEKITVPCSWALPTPEGGGLLDSELVNVTLDVDGTPVDLGRVASAEECANVDNAWHYDMPEAPTTIHACPSTCEMVEGADTNVGVNVVFGCKTLPAIPK